MARHARDNKESATVRPGTTGVMAVEVVQSASGLVTARSFFFFTKSMRGNCVMNFTVEVVLEEFGV